MLGVKPGANPPCSRDLTMHYSFDYEQQVHYPSDPLQPGQVYFLVPCNKGSNAVISYLHHFFSQYGLREKHIQLHCDNCSGQNKNKVMLWYLAWRCMNRFRHTPVSSLENICHAVSYSTSESNVNIPQLVSDETGQVFVPTQNCHNFLTPSFKPLPGVEK
eukprot:superscaffoldBa00002010_g12861